MATKEIKCCDVTGSTKDVTTILVRVEGNGLTPVEHRVDLCPRAYQRLLRFLVRGTTPASKGKDEQEQKA